MKKFQQLFILVFLYNSLMAQTNNYPATGNVGLGTSDPRAKLHLSYVTASHFHNHVPDDALLMIGGQDNQFSGQFINFRNPSNNDINDMYWWSPDILFGRYKNIAKWSFKENHGTPYGQSVKDIIYAKLQDAGGYTNVEKLILLPDAGNVGIGTSTPQAKLAVNGDILSKKVKVTSLGWADYVFHNNYRLRPLSEVEQYIQQHHHLPEVPSAEEVEKNGIDLGDNQATLLKKIEELTLYVIEQNKKLELQQQEIDKLKKQVNK
jgi:hypothetical protein